MVKVQFFPLDITYKIIEGKAVVTIYGRTPTGEQVLVLDDSFKPYFYAVLKRKSDLDKMQKKLLKLEVERTNVKARVVDTEHVKKKFLGKDKDVIKVYLDIPRGVPVIKDVVKEWDDIESVHEYDILFGRKYMIDKGIIPFTLTEVEGEQENLFKAKVPSIKAVNVSKSAEETLSEPKVLALDIETYNKDGNVDMEKDPILMIGLYSKGYRKVITWKKFKTDEKFIEFVNSESEMIAKFKEEFEKFSPDIVTGYFTDGFDFPYIEARAKKYKLKLELGLDYSELQMKGRELTESRIIGVSHIDVLRFVRNIVGRTMKTDSYSLDNVAAEILGKRKRDVNISELFDAWDNHNSKLEEFARYNLQDCMLVYELFESFLPQIVELVKIVGIIPGDAIRMSVTQLLDAYMLRNEAEFNEIAPNKPSYEEARERMFRSLKGGFVYEPKPGLHKDIVVFDFRSLYPSIIASHNISLETLNCGCCKDGKNKAPEEELKDKKIWFCENKKGFVSSLIGDIITRRTRINEMIKEDKKNPLLEARSKSLKLLANSFYGYLGFARARWYKLEAAQAVTAWGRHYIHKVIDEAEKAGFEVLYSDTDSVFLKLNEKSKKDAIKFQERINKSLPGLMELEYEGYSPRGLFVAMKSGAGGAKKKYALLNEDGSIKIRGFETVRRNWSKIAKDLQEEVLSMVLADNNAEGAFDHVKEVIKKLQKNEIPVKKVIIKTQLQKDISSYDAVGPHVKAAMRLKNRGEKVKPGTIIRYVITKGKGIIGDRARLPDEVEQKDYDPDYYINNQIIPSVTSIFEALGFDVKELAEKAGQSKLGKFF